MKTIEWIMMGAFVGGLVLAFYKLYLFFPKTRLADDDMTPESVELLERIMVECNNSHSHLDEESLFQMMTVHHDFDSKHFWRFNENRLRHLIEHYRLKEPNFRR
ncbi:hypothetical protein [Sulfuricurvum sp.]|uniref:hypothetical protein n=1 Tax=Sulfuricurvum sp. TaxID=2025608 RepID=UPI002D3FCD6B|nr:hypothetical protein [Sulfuricurvum sp.]HZF70990.1 hypothetical protein [Sulfuricurvum sp.]